jgi:hypothetical protein
VRERGTPRCRRGGPLVLLVLPALLGVIVLAEPAIGGTASFESGVLSYLSAPGERDGLRAELGSGSVDVHLDLHARDSAGVGCELFTPPPWEPGGYLPPSFIRCPLPAVAPAPEVNIRLGDADDRGGAASLGGVIDGGPGNDTIFGCGLLLGGAGRDSVYPDGNDPAVPDGRRAGCRGVDDSARGFGGPGDDFMSALDESGPVLFDGGPGDDVLQGALGPDVLRGGGGADKFFLEGRRGDVIEPGPGRDWVIAEYNRGNDKIRARDGSFDYVGCGAGRDSVVLDGLDFYAGPLDGGSGRNPRHRCERVSRRGPARPVTAGATADFALMAPLFDPAQGSLEVAFACPYDGPRPCTGSLIVKNRRRTILRRRFHTPGLGLWYDHYQIPRRALRSLTKWASLSVVAHDRRGRKHRQTMRGSHIVDVYIPEDEGD